MESFVKSYQLSVEECEPKLAPLSSEFQTLGLCKRILYQTLTENGKTDLSEITAVGERLQCTI